MSQRVKKVNLLAFDSNWSADFDLIPPPDESQIVRDWHIWLKSLTIIKPRTIEGISQNQEINGMEQLLLDAFFEKDSDVPVLKDEKLLEFAKRLQKIRKDIKTHNQIDAENFCNESTSSDTTQRSQQQQPDVQLQALEAEKAELLKEAREAFEQPHLTREILQQFWRKHLIPAQQQQQAEKYVEFLTQYGHQGGVLHDYIRGLQEYTSKRGGHLVPSEKDMRLVMTVSDKAILAESIYRIRDISVWNKGNQCFYQFESKSEDPKDMMRLTSQVTLGVSKQGEIDVTSRTGLGKDVSKKMRQFYTLIVYPSERKTGVTGEGVPFVYYDRIEGEAIESPIEKADIIRHFLMWLEDLLEQIRHKLEKLVTKNKKNEKVDAAVSGEQSPLLSSTPV